MVDTLRVIRDDGSTDPRLDPKFGEERAVDMYRWMSLQRILDSRMLALQRQGRIGFYGPSLGQEAAIVGAAIVCAKEEAGVGAARPSATISHARAKPRRLGSTPLPDCRMVCS